MFVFSLPVLLIRSEPLEAFVTGSQKYLVIPQLFYDAWDFIAKYRGVILAILGLALVVLFLVWIFAGIQKKKKQQPAKEHKAAAGPSKIIKNNPEPEIIVPISLGRSIVRAAWILGISAIFCTLCYMISIQYRSSRYLPLDKYTYIDTWTGTCYYAGGNELK